MALAKDEDIRRLRALKMIEMRITNHTYRQIAEAFNISMNTVERTLSWAKKAGIVASAEDKILQELVPAAHKALAAALADGENKQEAGKLALALMNRVLPDNKAKAPKAGVVVSDPGDELYQHIARLRSGDGTIDGVVAEDEDGRALPPAEEGALTEGPAASADGDGVFHHSASEGAPDLDSDEPPASTESD